jgi:amino acid transporter
LTAIIYICALVLLITTALFNRGASAELDTTLSRVLLALSVVASMLAVAWYWFRPRPDLPTVPKWNLKRNAPGRWVLLGLSQAVVGGAFVFVFAYWLLTGVAPFLPGSMREHLGTVIDPPTEYSRGRCATGLRVNLDQSGEKSFCVRTSWGDSVLSSPVESYQRVRVVTRQTALGTVLVSIAPSGT